MADIPVYLIAGFLDGGKTNFINGILEDGFAREDKTLLICCEEGEEEYEQKALDNVTVVTVDDEDELTADSCCKAGEEVPAQAGAHRVQRHVADGTALPRRAARQLGALPDHDLRAGADVRAVSPRTWASS